MGRCLAYVGQLIKKHTFSTYCVPQALCHVVDNMVKAQPLLPKPSQYSWENKTHVLFCFLNEKILVTVQLSHNRQVTK